MFIPSSFLRGTTICCRRKKIVGIRPDRGIVIGDAVSVRGPVKCFLKLYPAQLFSRGGHPLQPERRTLAI
jgi:hypothetical protein